MSIFLFIFLDNVVCLAELSLLSATVPDCMNKGLVLQFCFVCLFLIIFFISLLNFIVVRYCDS